MSASRHQHQWERLFEQKKHDLLENDCTKAVQISSFDELQAALHDIATESSQGSFPDIINKLNPSLNHLKSFAEAITSASQFQPAACLVWGAVQAVVLAACQTAYQVDEMLDIISSLNESLPQFGSYLEMFPDAQALQYHLQDLYDDYMDYCISCIQYIKRSPSASFLRYFITSSPQQALKRTKDNINKHVKLFRRAAQLAYRQSSLKQHKQIQQHLVAAPLTEVPEDSSRADEKDLEFPISTVTMYRNYTFLGRDSIMQSIHDGLCPSVPSSDIANGIVDEKAPPRHGLNPTCCVLHGLGGIGKTQTALEYTYLYRDEYDAIFWIQSEQDSSLAATFASIAEKLELTEDLGSHDGQNTGRAVERVATWLKNTTRKWLLVFDNVEDIDDLNPYFPLDVRTPGGIIITTQKSTFFPITDKFSKIKVTNFNSEQGAELIFKYLQRGAADEDEQECACQISDLLDGLPLALATIGGYINQSDSSVSEYLESLRTSSKAWKASAIGPVKQYEKRLETVFDMALRELPENARCLINMLAFLNPDHIPEDLFIANIGNESINFLRSRAELLDIVRILRRRQLVRRDTSGSQPYLSIHRTVQWSVLLNLSKDNDHRWEVFRQTFVLLRRGMPLVSPIDNPEPEKWAEFEKYVPQILNLRTHCLWPEPPVELPADFAQVLSDMATYMWHAGLFREGTDALITAENILDDQHIGIKNPLRSNIHEHLGIFASFNGVSERDEAMDRRKKASEARQISHNQIPKGKVTRDDEIRLFNVESDMAFGLMQGEDFEEVERYIERCHIQYKSWGTEDDIPFEYLKYNHIISYVRMSQGRPVDAIATCKRAAALGEICAGLLHPMTWLCRFTLANHLYLAGEHEDSLKENLRVLSARIKICGEFNHFTLESYSMCASLLIETGKLQNFEEAERLLLKCLDRRKRVAWNEEGVARAQYFYSKVLTGLGKPEEAEEQLNSARKTRDRYLNAYPQWLKADPDDELVVFDQMVSLWAGRYTGKLKQPATPAFVPDLDEFGAEDSADDTIVGAIS